MKKLSPAASLLLAPLLLTACGGGSSGTAAHASSSQSAAANANNVASGHNCPILNGRFVLPADGDSEDDQTIYLNTHVDGGNFSYSFVNPKLGAPNYQPADGVSRQVPNDPEGSDQYRVSCDSASITYLTRQNGQPDISIRYAAIGADQLKVTATGAGSDFLNGVYKRKTSRF